MGYFQPYSPFDTITKKYHELSYSIEANKISTYILPTLIKLTDVMYETMTVYPLSWTYYLSFIFFTAFTFLNMVIGIVVNVMNAEKG